MSIIKRKAGSEDIVKSVLEFDETPTEGSPNLVESGAVAAAIGNLGKGFAKTKAISPEYDSTATYAVGDAVMHDGLRYECNTAISTAEAWNADHWTEKSVEDEIGNVETLLAAL